MKKCFKFYVKFIIEKAQIEYQYKQMVHRLLQNKIVNDMGMLHDKTDDQIHSTSEIKTSFIKKSVLM